MNINQIAFGAHFIRNHAHEGQLKDEAVAKETPNLNRRLTEARQQVGQLIQTDKDLQTLMSIPNSDEIRFSVSPKPVYAEDNKGKRTYQLPAKDTDSVELNYQIGPIQFVGPELKGNGQDDPQNIKGAIVEGFRHWLDLVKVTLNHRRVPLLDEQETRFNVQEASAEGLKDFAGTVLPKLALLNSQSEPTQK